MLETEETIAQKLTQKFPEIECKVIRVRRLTATTTRENLLEVAAFLKDELGFNSLCTITALDSGEDFEMIYHFANAGVVLSLKVMAPKTDPVFDTVTGLYEGATLYELEAHNLLGLTVKDIPIGIKYPLPDDWPDGEYPLRKDWKKPADEKVGDQ